jgi:nucleoside-diphosphate-sugar epimerase
VPRALIIGGTGAIGFAVARRLLAAGWRVEITGRDPSHVPQALAADGARFSAVDRDDSTAMRAVLGGGADLLVDCVCYTAVHAATLLPFVSSVTSTVMISSKAVYIDANGRHANSDFPPCFEGPIGERQPTMRPNEAPYDSREGYGANKVAAEEVLLDSGYPITVLRPSKVHGAWSRRPREWVFVKRILDKRPVLLLAQRGTGVDHPSAADNVAALIEFVAAHPGRRILNSADPDAPNVLEISRVVAGHLGHSWEEVLLADSVTDGRLGQTPWSSVPPIVLDTTAAAELGYRPAGTYATTVPDEIDWLIAVARDPTAAWALPADDDPYFAALLDYAAEDRYLATQPATARHSASG